MHIKATSNEPSAFDACLCSCCRRATDLMNDIGIVSCISCHPLARPGGGERPLSRRRRGLVQGAGAETGARSGDKSLVAKNRSIRGMCICLHMRVHFVC